MGSIDAARLVTYTLGNGLQIVGQVQPDVQSCAVVYYVRVGSRAEESPETAGIAHLCEHMAFRTTRIRSGLELNQAFQWLGMDVNAATSTDATLYHASGPGDPGQVISLLSEMMSPLLQHEEIEIEKGAILNEILQEEENPSARLLRYLGEAYFSSAYNLAHGVLGTSESVRNICTDQIRDFWMKHYTANNIIVSVAGNFREEDLIASVKRCCGTWQPCEALPRVPFLYIPDPQTRIVVDPSQQQQFIMLAMPAAPKGDPLYLAALLSARILEKRLYWLIVQKGLAEDIDVDLWADNIDILQDIGILLIETNTTPESAPLVLTLIKQELSHLLQEGITESELLRAKNMMLSGRLLGYEESRLFRAWELAEQWDFEGRLLTIEEELHHIEQIGRDDVMRALHLFPILEKQVVAALGPLGQEELVGREGSI